MGSVRQGAGVGLILSTGCMLWLSISAQLAKVNGLVSTRLKPFSTDGCSHADFFNSTLPATAAAAAATTNSTQPQLDPQVFFSKWETAAEISFMSIHVSNLDYCFNFFLIIISLLDRYLTRCYQPISPDRIEHIVHVVHSDRPADRSRRGHYC